MTLKFVRHRLLVGDVFLDGDIMGDLAVGLPERNDDRGLDLLLPISIAVNELACPCRSTSEGLPH